VGADRANADVPPHGDLGVGAALADQSDEFLFPDAEAGQFRRWLRRFLGGDDERVLAAVSGVIEAPPSSAARIRSFPSAPGNLIYLSRPARET
jgi:hypothetical protein